MSKDKSQHEKKQKQVQLWWNLLAELEEAVESGNRKAEERARQKLIDAGYKF